MKNKPPEHTYHEYSEGKRLLFLAGLAPVFLLLLPYLLLTLGAWLERALGWQPLRYPPFNLLLGLLLIGAGLGLAMWTIYTQFTLGRGTPVPLMATQRLIVRAPYSLCRNPMALGTIAAYLGVAVLFGSPGAAAAVLIFSAALLVYIKRVEEKEMELRFGQSYLDYRRSTPFLIPRLPGKPHP